MLETEADVFMLPFAVLDPDAVTALRVDPWVLSRRIPDFLHQLVNQGDAVPTGMVEIQTRSGRSGAAWVEMRHLPAPEEAFDMLPPGCRPRALVLGTLAASAGDLALELHVHFAEDLDAPASTTLKAVMPCGDPATALQRLAERLARVLDVTLPPLPSGLLTRNGAAFFAFLAGLDGAALASGQLAIDSGRPQDLLEPLAEALRLDPSFGLALRTWHAATAAACSAGRLDRHAWGEQADACLGARPRDGEACVFIADRLAALGDQERALRWLEHAVHLSPPPPRGLESLGIAFANRGDIGAARELWLAGLEQDGHPDFFAHLARLSFACGDEADAWDKIVCGLRRMHERVSRLEEWGDDGRGCGVLLAYLLDHFRERRPPQAVERALRDLCDTLRNAEDRVELGICLLELGVRDAARSELRAGLSGELPADMRDRGVRALLRLRVRDFEARFAAAVEAVAQRRDVPRALVELQRLRQLEPGFWLATYWAGLAQRGLGQEEAALDLMAEVLRQRAGQPDALTEMADLFDRRGNPKRALECIDAALDARPGNSVLLGRRALYQHRLGRTGPARESLEAALVGGPPTAELEEIRRQIQA
jgi:tetratricopeptide (TPR) repeat protein